MSIQAALNNDSINAIPKIKEVINEAEDYQADLMKQSALRSMMNSRTAIDDMNNEELEEFQNDLKQLKAYTKKN